MEKEVKSGREIVMQAVLLLPHQERILHSCHTLNYEFHGCGYTQDYRREGQMDKHVPIEAVSRDGARQDQL